MTLDVSNFSRPEDAPPGLAGVSTGVSSSPTGVNVLAYGAKGDGVSDDTASIQSAINAAGALALPNSSVVDVLFPAGYTFLFATVTITSGIRISAYGATLKPLLNGWTKAWFYYPANSTPAQLQFYGMSGGTYIGTGTEGTANSNMFLYGQGTNTGVQDLDLRDMFITNWGSGCVYYPRVAGRVRITGNTIICNEVNNNGFQNTITIDPGGTNPPFTGRVMIDKNFIHNSTADAIAIVVVSNLVGGPFYTSFTDNILTADPPTADTTAGFTNASPNVTTTNYQPAAVGRYVTANVMGVPKVSYITTASSGTTGAAGTYVLANGSIGGPSLFSGTTGAGTLYWNVRRNGVGIDIDALSNAGFSDVIIARNNITGYERTPLFVASASVAGKNTTRVIISENLITNGQGSAAAAWAISNPQGSGIGLSGSNLNVDINIINNRITCASAVPPIAVQTANALKNYGYQSGNKFTTGQASGVATLVAGTVTVSTTEIQAVDNVIISRAVAGGTLGDLSIGTITAGTTFTITSSSGSDTSNVYWKIDH